MERSGVVNLATTRAPLPEASGTLVFAVGLSRNGFVQTVHEPTGIGKSCLPNFYYLCELGEFGVIWVSSLQKRCDKAEPLHNRYQRDTTSFRSQSSACCWCINSAIWCDVGCFIFCGCPITPFMCVTSIGSIGARELSGGGLQILSGSIYRETVCQAGDGNTAGTPMYGFTINVGIPNTILI